MTNEMQDKLVVVTTKYRGTYVGKLKDFDRATEQVVLTDVRMVIYWGTTRGYQELAVDGPTEKTKPASMSPMAWIPGVTSVDMCTQKAVEAWAAVR